jgi:hypothetical protein
MGPGMAERVYRSGVALNFAFGVVVRTGQGDVDQERTITLTYR